MLKIKSLFLAANPISTERLSLDKEVREISSKIRASEYRDSIELISVWAVRPDDLIQSLNEYKPQIVHFSGHGSSIGEIVLIDELGNVRPIAPTALKALFSALKDNIRIVILNACYSKIQSEAITEVIDCAIGMSTAITDDAAITFIASFYRALAFGRSVQESFNQGKTAILLAGFPEENTPELLVNSGVDASKIILVTGKEIDKNLKSKKLEETSTKFDSQIFEPRKPYTYKTKGSDITEFTDFSAFGFNLIELALQFTLVLNNISQEVKNDPDKLQQELNTIKDPLHQQGVKIDQDILISMRKGIRHLIEGLNSSISRTKENSFMLAHNEFSRLINLDTNDINNAACLGYWGNFYYFNLMEDKNSSAVQVYECTTKYPRIGIELFPKDFFGKEYQVIIQGKEAKIRELTKRRDGFLDVEKLISDLGYYVQQGGFTLEYEKSYGWDFIQHEMKATIDDINFTENDIKSLLDEVSKGSMRLLSAIHTINLEILIKSQAG